MPNKPPLTLEDKFNRLANRLARLERLVDLEAPLPIIKEDVRLVRDAAELLMPGIRARGEALRMRYAADPEGDEDLN